MGTGLTCDPIGGLVQIPCIERNALGAAKAVTASQLALGGDGHHRYGPPQRCVCAKRAPRHPLLRPAWARTNKYTSVTLDQVIETMRQTGADMQSKYKETSLVRKRRDGEEDKNRGTEKKTRNGRRKHEREKKTGTGEEDRNRAWGRREEAGKEKKTGRGQGEAPNLRFCAGTDKASMGFRALHRVVWPRMCLFASAFLPRRLYPYLRGTR